MDPVHVCKIYDFVIEGVCMGILCLFGFCGNSLSMACLLRDKSKTATPFLLVSLEVADTLFLITVMILRVFSSLQLSTNWFPALKTAMPYLGQYIYPCALIAETGTVYLTILVTLNRYISVCRPYEASDLCSIRNARKHVLGVTIFAIIFNVPRFLEYKVVEVEDNHQPNKTINHLLATDFERHTAYQIIYKNILYFVVMFCVPLVSLVILNYKLTKALNNTRRRRSVLLNSSAECPNRSEDDITLILIVVVLVFVICQTPALVTQVLVCILDIDVRRCPNAFFYYERFSDLLVVGNSSLNFIIYCFCSKRFRQILVNLVSRKKSLSPEPSHAVGQDKEVYPIARCAGSHLLVPGIPEREKTASCTV